VAPRYTHPGSQRRLDILWFNCGLCIYRRIHSGYCRRWRRAARCAAASL